MSAVSLPENTEEHYIKAINNICRPIWRTVVVQHNLKAVQNHQTAETSMPSYFSARRRRWHLMSYTQSRQRRRWHLMSYTGDEGDDILRHTHKGGDDILCHTHRDRAGDDVVCHTHNGDKGGDDILCPTQEMKEEMTFYGIHTKEEMTCHTHKGDRRGDDIVCHTHKGDKGGDDMSYTQRGWRTRWHGIHERRDDIWSHAKNEEDKGMQRTRRNVSVSGHCSFLTIWPKLDRPLAILDINNPDPFLASCTLDLEGKHALHLLHDVTTILQMTWRSLITHKFEQADQENRTDGVRITHRSLISHKFQETHHENSKGVRRKQCTKQFISTSIKTFSLTQAKVTSTTLTPPSCVCCLNNYRQRAAENAAHTTHELLTQPWRLTPCITPSTLQWLCVAAHVAG